MPFRHILRDLELCHRPLEREALPGDVPPPRRRRRPLLPGLPLRSPPRRPQQRPTVREGERRPGRPGAAVVPRRHAGVGLRPLQRRVEGDDQRPSGLNQSYGRWETIVSDYPFFSVVQNAFLKDGASWGPVPLFHVSGALRLFLTTGEGPSGILFEDTKYAIVNFAKLALKCQV